MSQGALSLPDPLPPYSRGERRLRVRQKLYSPVYASFKNSQSGAVVDLSELLDLSEDGFAVHTAEPLEVNKPLDLTLDLSESGTHIHGRGVTMWSDASGRSGVRFSDLSDSSRRLLKEWLFNNLLVAVANHRARSAQRFEREEALPEEFQKLIEESDSALASDLVLIFSAVDTVREQVRACADLDAALGLITRCALGLTGGSGAALALLRGDHMICRARSGETAPSLGALVDVRKGLSGECIRSGRMVSSNDTENDPRVDRETCRALGIGSILAAPIVADFRVIGLLEVFSPSARAFTKVHATILDRLVEAVPRKHAAVPSAPDAGASKASTSAAQPAPAAVPYAQSVQAVLGEPESKFEPFEAQALPRNVYLALMALAFLVAAPAAAFLGYLLAPTLQSQWLRWSGEPTANAAVVAAAQTSAGHFTVANSPEQLEKLADSGDADAQYWLAIRYSTGTTVLQNDAEAARWFERAAQQGHVLAQARLGSYYWGGRGVPRDLAKAYMWARLAWAQGDEDSKSLLEGLSTQMTRTELVAASQQADTWLRQHNERRLAPK